MFIEPKPPNFHIFSRFPIPRLGNFQLATIARQMGWDSEVIVEEISGFDVKRPPGADIVGISTITSTAPRAYQIADTYRRRGVPVILGGPHVSFVPEEAIEHADFVVRGEGEMPFTGFLEAFEHRGEVAEIPNLSYWSGKDVIHNAPSNRATDLSKVPIPDLTLLRSPGRDFRRHVLPMETSRGCPFNCEFCSVGKMFGRKMRFRPIDEIIEALKRGLHRAKSVFFVDDNFAANPERTKRLLRAIINAGLRINWSAQVRCDAARDEELLDLMQRSGCAAVYVGIESINPETLERVKKMQTADSVAESIAKFHRRNIRVHGMFILGFDEDDRRSVRRTWRYALRNMLNTVQFLILTPLPGTQMFQKLQDEQRILTNNWSLYDAHHVVFKPRGMRPIDLQRLQIKAHEKFYSWMQQLRRLFRFEFFEFAIAEYANRLTRRWKTFNSSFMHNLKQLSKRFVGR